MDCNICYETYANSNSFIWLPCLHNLCEACYNKLVQPICPYCRNDIVGQRVSNNSHNLSISAPERVIQYEYEIWEDINNRREDRVHQRHIDQRHRRARRIQRIAERVLQSSLHSVESMDDEIFQLELDDRPEQKHRNDKNNRWNHLNNQASRYSRNY